LACGFFEESLCGVDIASGDDEGGDGCVAEGDVVVECEDGARFFDVLEDLLAGGVGELREEIRCEGILIRTSNEKPKECAEVVVEVTEEGVVGPDGAGIGSVVCVCGGGDAFLHEGSLEIFCGAIISVGTAVDDHGGFDGEVDFVVFDFDLRGYSESVVADGCAAVEGGGTGSPAVSRSFAEATILRLKTPPYWCPVMGARPSSIGVNSTPSAIFSADMPMVSSSKSTQGMLSYRVTVRMIRPRRGGS